MVPIAIGLNINWVAIGDRFNLYHVMMYLGIKAAGLSIHHEVGLDLTNRYR